MGDLRLHIRLAFCLTAFVCGGVTVAQSQTMQDYEAKRVQVAGLHAALQEVAPSLRHASDLAPLVEDFVGTTVSHGNHSFPAPQEMANGDVTLVDLRLALVQMSFAVGSNDQITIVRAQPVAQPQVIAIRNGAVDLRQLQAWAATLPDPTAIIDGDTLRLPLVIFQNARFDLTPGDLLRLSQTDGAFIANLGTLVVNDAEISATAQKNLRAVEFAPFVTTIGTGMAHMSNALFADLGFGDTAAFSGVAVINRGLYQPIGASFLTGSVLRNVKKVTFDSADSPAIAGNAFVGANAGALELRNSRDADITANFFLNNARGAALRVTDGSLGTTIAGNIVLGSDRTGIAVNRGSNDTIIRQNLVWKSGGGGISASRSNCIYVADNISIDNALKGIELRTSQNAEVLANQLLGNQSIGLFVADQPVGTLTQVTDNTFVANRIGLSSASAHRLTLHGNNFQNQFPRFLDGDLAAQSHQIVADLRGEHDIDLTAGGIEVFNQPPVTCTFKVDS